MVKVNLLMMIAYWVNTADACTFVAGDASGK